MWRHSHFVTEQPETLNPNPETCRQVCLALSEYERQNPEALNLETVTPETQNPEALSVSP